MKWTVTHQHADGGDVTVVPRDDATSSAAIEAVRATLPEGHKLLAIRRGEDS